MIGSGNNKDCEEWFFDRIVQGRPILIPGSGMQLTNISHVKDLSSMLTLAVENPAAACCKIFNYVSDRAVTLDGMAKLCAQAAGLPVEIVHYDPKALSFNAKKAFPFRNMVMTFLWRDLLVSWSSRMTNCLEISEVVRTLSD